MTTCDRCGKKIRRVFPVYVKPPTSFEEARNGPIPRNAMWVLGIPEPPWGEHPDDDMFENWCEACVAEAKKQGAA